MEDKQLDRVATAAVRASLRSGGAIDLSSAVDVEVRSSGFDDDGLRERADTQASERRRRELERAAQDAHAAQQDYLRAEFAAGRMSMAEFARTAREAGIGTAEVAASLKERAAAEKAAERTAEAAAAARREAEAAAESETDSQLLAAAKGAKAQGLERLRRGDAPAAAEAFADAAALAERAAAEMAQAEETGGAAEALAALRESSLLNEALCRLKEGEWELAAAACSAVLERARDNPKARYRRGQGAARQIQTLAEHESREPRARQPAPLRVPPGFPPGFPLGFPPGFPPGLGGHGACWLSSRPAPPYSAAEPGAAGRGASGLGRGGGAAPPRQRDTARLGRGER